MHRKRSMEERREQRRARQHADTASAGRQAYRSAPGIRTWATHPLAMAVSGQGAVAVLVQSGPCAWLIGVRISLLAGGYLGTCKRRVAGDITLDRLSQEESGEALPSWEASEEIGRRLFGGRYRPWGEHLRPAPVPLASRLIWGAEAYRRSRGLHQATDVLPALGHLPPPAGHFPAWCADFVRRFDASQVTVADAILKQRSGRGTSSGMLFGSVPSVLSPTVDFELETDVPLMACAAFDQHPTELVPVADDDQATCYRWIPPRIPRTSEAPDMPAPSGAREAMPRQARGILSLDSRGRLLATVRGVARASALAMRIHDLVPSFRLRTCRWSRAHEAAGDAQQPGRVPAASPERSPEPAVVPGV